MRYSWTGNGNLIDQSMHKWWSEKMWPKNPSNRRGRRWKRKTLFNAAQNLISGQKFCTSRFPLCQARDFPFFFCSFFFFACSLPSFLVPLFKLDLWEKQRVEREASLGKTLPQPLLTTHLAVKVCVDSRRRMGLDVGWHGLDIVNTCYGVDYLVNRFVERLLFKCWQLKAMQKTKKKIYIYKRERPKSSGFWE